jgi:hypothetical protein
MNAKFVPVLSSHNSRYRAATAVGASATARKPVAVISCLPTSGKNPLPKGWRELTHPEGDTYHYNDEKKIVTANDSRDPAALEMLLKAFDILRRAAYEKIRDRLPQAELFLHVNLKPDSSADIRYYFADHATCQLFWVDDVPLASIGLPAFGSEAEIKLRLTPEYWTHVEYFPMHLALRQEAEDLIVAVLRHGCVDNMTSPGSTFPFGEAECRQYLSIFEGYKSKSFVEPRNAAFDCKLPSVRLREDHRIPECRYCKGVKRHISRPLH